MEETKALDSFVEKTYPFSTLILPPTPPLYERMLEGSSLSCLPSLLDRDKIDNLEVQTKDNFPYHRSLTLTD